MFYSHPFYIQTPVWNNAFSYEKRKIQHLYVPSLKKANTLDEIELWKEIVFEDIDEFWKLTSYTGLENFYHFSIKSGEKTIPLYLFDNHNHALFFWYQEQKNGNLKQKWNTLLHIDEHSDMRPSSSSIQDTSLENIFHYTNYVVNVWNYIKPVIEEWLIQDVVQIRDESSLEQDYVFDILNLDLDFFSPRLEYIPYIKKKDFILKHIEQAHIITVCTSPFFIDQQLALKVFKDLFSKKI